MIAEPYLLVLNIALHRHDGGYWAEPLWRKDLEAHLAGIATLAIACPVIAGPPPAGWERIARTEIVVHPLPPMGRSWYPAMPLIAAALWRAIGTAGIVHTGVAGWPYPLGWLAIPIARLRRRFTVLVVESAFWRIPPGFAASPLARLRARFSEAVNRALTRRCDVVFYTTQGYRDSLHAGAADTAHVLPAVWVDDDQLVGADRLAALAPAKGSALLFAGRLTAGKGVAVLLDAIARSGVPVDIVGDGDLRDTVAAAGAAMPALVRLRDPVDYGAAFSAMLDSYAALVVPTISDEQPRIIFDAFARGLPVLASATTGNRQIVDQGRTGILYPPNDAAALADALVDATADPARLHAMGATALQGMATRTHAAMHAVRAATIAAAFAGRARRR